ncbi:LysE family transporter [bacterium]|nr:LysE family transporter [bacterium]
MTYGAFLLQAILISLSGVLAPGPLTVVVVGKGAKSPYAGALIALGHGIVEFPLMVLILVGLGPLLRHSVAGAIIGLVGGLVLLWMGIGLLRSLRAQQGAELYRETSPLMAGILMSAGNPYFIVWWATVGATLVFRASEYGIWQFVVFAIIHWSLDLLWYFFLASASYRGTRILGERFLMGVRLVCGLLLLFFGIRFILDASGGFI